ncbi:acyl-CoA thioesterase [Spirosoma sp. KCTC 42546]|uniref:acyl-CoA thioesterase n=1 Tax=Spirosoma sp. KCTC 42546 TaxID=2520506 RepID=UPI001157F97A|nr:thioesterase family protein [Spirosoma sp. KCTC 42546]QDK81333.1 acyl-CoA thioesterase [Spirosoma sp. KCTC 42546]
MRTLAKTRSEFYYFQSIMTRWMDNDVYGHVNNVVYYSWFDTVVNQFLIVNQALDIQAGPVIGLVVETQCSYFSSVSFPEAITVGLAVTHIGNSSVRYELAIFKNDQDYATAQGHFVHVYVDRNTRRPTPLPEPLRNILQTILG